MRIIVCYFFGKKAIPLGESVGRALRRLGHEVRFFDSLRESRFNKGVLRYGNRILRSAGLGDVDLARGTRWDHQAVRERFLEEEIRAFRPDLLLVLRGNSFGEGFLRRMREEHGIRTIGWWVKGPKWMDLMKADAKIYDHYFCIHREGYGAEDGIGYLPAVAIDDDLYSRRDPAEGDVRDHDVLFVGGWNPRRQRAMESLVGLPVAIYGPKWRRNNLRNPGVMKMIRGRGVWGPDLGRLYNRSGIVLNISSWDTTAQSGLNLRVLDVIACGSFLLTDSSEDLAGWVVPGEEVETYRTVEELREKIAYYLENEAARAAIARRGWEKSKRLETYVVKMKNLLALAGDS